MKKTSFIISIAALLFSCRATVIAKNQAVIDGLVSARQVSKSIKVEKYRITHHEETHDSLIVYIQGKGPGNTIFLDTIRQAKNADGTLAVAAR